MAIEYLDDKLRVINTEIDVSLVDMVRENERIIRGYMHCGGGKSLWDADIAWDFPAQVLGDVWDEDAAKLSHAIGFISGVAAACDVTPLELLAVVAEMGATRREKATAIPVQAMATRDLLTRADVKRTDDKSKKRQRIKKVK